VEEELNRALLMLPMVAFAMAAQGGQISGHAKATDSTTIQISDQRVMLFGLDSVMRKQVCALDGKPWQCWQAAVHDLQTLLDEGPVSCEVIGEPDVYGRVIGRCTVNGLSVNEQLIARGFALARPSETTDYVAAEAVAKEKRVGLWQGQFQKPSDFRKAAGIPVERP
jgi:endonuclease YncB( thermonuclease family)